MPKLKKIFIAFLTFCVFVTQTFSGVAMGTASAFSLVDGGEVFDLVALVVEDSLMEDGGYFGGLVPQYSGKLDADTMEERIMRYAEDVQKNSPRTVVKTLTYKKGSDTLLGVINALENLYKNGDENVNSRLRGVVLIGDIPLPVVSKNGNRFISMFPLTDFDEKAYIYNSKTESFEANTSVSLPKPEIWHGVLKAPQLDEDPVASEQELNKLAEFFDKNHLYHADVDEFSKFQRKLFLGDFLHESTSVNEDLYKLYQNFLAHMDDLAYLRFNKYWAEVLVGSTTDSLENDIANIPDEYSKSRDAMTAALKSSGGSAGAFENLPDLFSKDMILNYNKPYINAVSKFVSLANDLAIHTGRYDPEKSGLDTVPSLISIKDTFTQEYLKNASDALENKVNEIVGKLAEDLSIPSETEVWGTDGGKPFEVSYSAIDPNHGDFSLSSPIPFITDKENGNRFIFKNSYLDNERLYINGVSSEFLSTPKQCYPYLGSADEDFTDAEFPILTRSIRTDNVMSASQPYTLGINGFALPPEEALAKTNNEFDHGFIIENNSLYGLPAFYNNSPLKSAGAEVEVGDVILSIAPVYRVDAGKFKDPFGDFETSNLLSECEVCKNNPLDPLCIESDKSEVLAKGFCKPTISPEQEKEDATVLVKSERDIKNIVSGFAQSVGGKKKGGSDTDNIYWDDKSYLTVAYYDVSAGETKTVDIVFNNLSPFSTLERKEYVYGLGGGENQLNGCFFASGVLHDDRCFALTATYPVLDPAGSYAPYTFSGSGVLFENNDGGLAYVKGGKEENYVNNLDVSEILYTHQFPAGKQVIETKVNDKNETVVSGYKTHKEMFGLPAGRDFSEVDDIYMDACFNFLPEAVGEIVPEAPPDFVFQWTTLDLYSWVTEKMKQYASSKEGKKNQNLPYGGGGINVPVVDSSDQFVVDNNYTLGDFAEHFGLYDGIDNDGNGVIDYKQDGDNFVLDISEADPAYGIDPDNVYQVGRFLLGKRYKWKNPVYGGETVPDGEYWYPMVSDLAAAMNDPDYKTAFDADTDVILKVKPNEFMKISSIILHNEPTNYTIGKQSEAGYSLSLPTDDPRYVAFMDANGDTQKLVYPSLFKSLVDGQGQSHAKFLADIDLLTEKISLIPGAEDKELIKKQLLSVTVESEEETFAKKNYISYMTKADGAVLADTLKWNGLSVDDKHEYILQYYLNAGADYNPYVNDPGLGYEAAYLVFDGGSEDSSDYVEMGFNREPLNEDNAAFNPYASYEELVGSDVDPETGYKNETEEDKAESPFVNLISFFTDEIPKTFKEFKNMKVGMKSACGEMCFAVGDSDECDDQVLDSIELSVSKDGAFSDGADFIKVTVIGLNSDGEPYTGSSEPELEIIISQDGLNPSFVLQEADKQKVLSGGAAVYKLYTTKNPGSAKVTVKAFMDDYEKASEPIELTSTAKKIDLISSAGTFVAGEDAEITLSAKLIGGDGGEVLFEIVEGADSVTFVDGNVAKAVNGIAEVSIKPTTLAGLVKITASTPKGVYYAPAEKEIAVIPSDPAKVQILADTDTLVANGESKAHLRFKLYDEYNNLLSTAFEQLAAFVFGDAKLDETKDLSKLIPGIEMVINEGVASIDLYSKEKTGEANVYVVLVSQDLEGKLTESTYTKEDVDFGGSIGASKKFSVIADANLQIIPEKMEISADGVSTTKITAKLTKTNGEVISGYEGPVAWSINDSSLGNFDKEPPVEMNKGASEVTLVSTTKAGTLSLSVEAPGFAKNSVNITTLPGAPVKLTLASDEKAIYTSSPVGTKLKATLLDQYDNVAYLSSVPITFKTTDGTANMVVFDGEVSSYATKGYGEITVKAKDKSGKVNLIVESPGLEQGILALDVKKKISNYSLDNFEKFSPKALYINLLGAAFSDFGKDDLAASLLYNGQTQALLSVTASAEEKKQLVFVDGYGQIDTLDENVLTEVVNADDSFGFTRIKFADQASGDELGQAFFVPKDGLELKLIEEEGEATGSPQSGAVAEGILVKKIASENASLKFVTSEDGKKIFIKNNEEVLASIDQYGRISLSSKDIILQVPGKDSTEDRSYFSLLIGWRGMLVGQVTYKQDSGSGVITLQSTNKSTTFLPGIYLKLSKEGTKYAVKSGYSKYSTEFLKGAYIVDTEAELSAMSRPGFGYTSVENAADNDGVGMQYNNKNVLLFAAGNTAGEANIPYASDSGVLLGDPTVKIENAEEDLILDSGFTKDLGQSVFIGDSKINRIVPFDYNGDGLTDILLSLDDGRLRLLQNENSNERFTDRGYLLNVVNGIISINTLDIDGDDYDDLIIGTEESCVVGEKCLYLYKNTNGNFERKKLELNILNKDDKISEIQTGDLNKDGFDDAVILDSSGYVYVFWNNKGKLDSNGVMLGNFGLSVDSNELIDDILVNYEGMPEPADSRLLVKMTVKATDGKTETVNDFNFEEKNPSVIRDFILTKYDPGLIGSVKSVSDGDGPPLKLGDTLKYTITLKNSGSSAIKNLTISDITPSAQTIIESSLKCIDVNCPDALVWKVSDLALRERVITGISIPAKGKRNITYEAIVKATPTASVNLGDFENDTEFDDEYLDILVKPDEADSVQLNYFYSNGLDDEGRIIYQKTLSIPEPEPAPTNPVLDEVGNIDEDLYKVTVEDPNYLGEDISDANATDCDPNEDPDNEDYCNESNDFDVPPQPPASVKELMASTSEDSDLDGVPDSMDSTSGVVSKASDIAGAAVEKIGNAINSLRCDGQPCLPIPYNYAFLVPYQGAPGFAALAILPNPPYVSAFYPSTGNSVFRFYLSPTLTMGLGMAICPGTYPSLFCFVGAIPLGKLDFMKKICKAIEDFIDNLLGQATKFVSSATGAATMLSNGQGANNTGYDTPTGQGGIEHNGSMGSTKTKMTFNDSINIRVPGFPGVLTDWMDNQMEEIFNKLLDLPDFYVILPDFGALFKQTGDAFKKFGDMKLSNAFDFLKILSQIPLIQIKGEEVVVKIPMINGDQITKYQKQAELLIKNIKEEWERTKQFWTCDESSTSKTICEKFGLKITVLISNLQKLLDTLETYKELPKQILQLRTAETKYAQQIICYLDSITELIGGYIKRQSKTIKAWVSAVAEIINQFRGWKALLNLNVDYQASCDQCKNEKYGEIGILLSLFAGALPDLPVIPIPKWPNIIFDLSKLQLGVEILWPDIVFKPQPIQLPDLPTIKFPSTIPDINIDLDGLIPDFDLPKWLPESFEIDLPDLPPLPLPDLPDLPRPPKIPALPKPIFDLTLVLKPILKILCIIKQGLFLFNEASGVKSEIEELTQPGVKPVLPITLSLGMQFPEISYDAPVEWQTSLKMKFGVNTRAIYTAVKELADKMNKKVEEYVSKINEYTNIDTGVNLDLTPELKEKLGIGPEWNIDAGKIKDKLDGDEESSNLYLAAENSFFVPDENMEIKEYVSDPELLENPYIAQIAELRNSLVSYVEGVEDSNKLLSDIEDLNEFAVALSDTDEGLDMESNLIASTDGVGDADVSERSLKNSYSQVVRFPMMLADASEYGLDLSKDSGNLTTPSKVVPEGLYVYVPETKTTDDILGYTDELGDDTSLAYIDVENDGDEDLLFSFKGDLYLKKNYKKNNTSAPNFPLVEGAVSIGDYADDGLSSVQGFISDAEKPDSVNVMFTPSKNANVAGYEIAAFRSLLEMDKNLYNGVYRYFVTSKPDEVFGLVTGVNGNGSALESTERIIYSANKSFSFSTGDVLYALEDSSFYVGSVVSLKEGEFYVIPNNLKNNDASVLNGSIEVAKKSGEKNDQPLIKNMTFIMGDKIKTGSTGGVDIKFNNGAKISLNENEIFEMLKLENLESPNLTLDLPDGNYYSVIYEISSDGEKSFVSTQTPLSPQVCGDNDAPLPAITNPNMSVAATKILKIDASSSFDPSGDIKGYYIDLDLEKDSDGDGDSYNDPDLWSDLDNSADGLDGDGNTSNDMDNPKFNVGPFDEEGDKKIAMTLIDEAGNSSTQVININVYVPKLTLDPVSMETPVIGGDTSPATDDMPLSLMRKRFVPRVEDEKLKLVLSTDKIVTKSADANGQYKTSNNGSYLIEDASLDDMILVKDAVGAVVAEVDPVTGNFWLKDGYSYKINPAQPPAKSTSVDLLGLGTIYFVSKGNTEVNIHEDFEFTTESVENLSGVHVSLDTAAAKDAKDTFEFKKYPANDPNYPNGVYLYYKNEKKHMVAIDTAGNILLLDDRMSLSKKDNQYKFDPFVYELKFDGKKVAEVYVSTNGIFDEVQIVGPKDVPSKFPNGVTPQYLYEEKELKPYTGSPLNPSTPVFSDLSGDLYDYAINLYHQGVISGDEKFDPNEPISRADFVIMLLKMLCIVPRAEAYEDPSIFSDITYSDTNLPFYYPYVKEAGLLGLIHGYGGETDASGMNPFRPESTLSLAEAVQVILNGMDMIGAVNIDGIKAGPDEPWYAPILGVAQNLAPFASQDVTLKSEFIITSKDVTMPNEALTRGKALELSFRVLNAYNCLEIDKDSDGMMDYCEKKNGIDDPVADPDKDGLVNKDECYYGTDPNKLDTDGGGVSDGDEVSYGTNPLNKSDDQTDKDGDGLSDVEETKVYKTDPNNPDTDAGGIYDGDEVKNQTDPNEKKDDYLVGQDGVEKAAGQIFETEAGVYFVPPSCTACPCPYTVEYKADLRKGDILYTIIVNKDETKIYTKSNEEKVN